MHHPITKANVRLGSTQPSHSKDTAHGPWADWQRHVDARRIGNNPPTDPAIRERVLRNERILLGERVVGVW